MPIPHFRDAFSAFFDNDVLLYLKLGYLHDNNGMVNAKELSITDS